MSGLVFVDTNVLVYAKDRRNRNKQISATQWLDALWDRGAGRLSFQVLKEFYHAALRPGGIGLASDDARAFVKAFLAWNPIVEDAGLIAQGWAVQDRYRFSWWDCLIVGAAHLAGCDYLLTEDLQHEQQLGRLTVLNPFEIDPSRLPSVRE